MADRQSRTTLTIEGLAHGYDLSGEADKAVEMYELLVSRPYKPVGWEPQQRWIEAHYYLARAFQEKGDVEMARARLQVLLDLWSDADAGIPLLQLARELEQKLEGQTMPGGSE